MFIVLWMYNFGSKVVHPGLTQVVLAEPLAEKSKWEAIERISLMAVVYTTSLSHLDPIGNSMGGGFNFVNPQNMYVYIGVCTVYIPNIFNLYIHKVQ